MLNYIVDARKATTILTIFGETMRTGENIRKRADGRYEARFCKGRDENGKILYGYAYGKTYEEARDKRDWQLVKLRTSGKPKQMNLLILGAGNHGREVFEVASGLRVFGKIAFLDDNKTGEDILGTCRDFEHYLDEWPIAIPGVGNSALRKKWTEELAAAGFVVPTLIDATASVSKDARIGYGTVICARAAVSLGASVGNGCIVSSGAVVAMNAQMEDWGFINSGETLLESGEIK